MYEQHYGLTRRPFTAAATGADVFVGPQTAKIMQGTKKALAASDAIVAVVGPAGVGKTTLVGHALGAIGGDKQIIRISRMQLGHDEILEYLLDEMHARNIPASTIKKITLFKKLVAEKSKSGTRVFIVVEDAVRIGDDTLAELEALTAADGHHGSGANMVLMGDESLRELLNTESLIRLKQRVRVYQNVNPLIAPELLGYLKHCFRLAGGEFDMLFADGAAQQIHALTSGLPRTTNNLVESVLNAGSEKQLAKIDVALINSVAEEEFGLTAKIPIIAAAPAASNLEPVPDAESQSSAADIREQIQDTLPDLSILAPDLAKNAANSKADADDSIPTLFNSGRMDVSETDELQKAKETKEAQLAKEAEETKQAQIAKQAEVAKKAKEAEEAKKAKEAQLAKEAEEARLAKEAEQAKKAEEARLAKEAEQAKKAEEARLAKEAAEAKKAEEARLAKEAEQAKKAEEARLAKEAEQAKKAEEARLAKEAEKAKKAEEARLAKEAEVARLAKEAEDAKQALLAKAAKEAQLEREAEAAKKAKEAKEAEEAKKAKEAEEAKKAKEAEEAKKALLAKTAKEAQLAREAEAAKKAQEMKDAEAAKKAQQAKEAEEAKKAQQAKAAQDAKKAQQAKAAEDAKKAQQAKAAEEPPEWERDPTLAELRPDIEGLEKAMAGLAVPDAAGETPGPSSDKPAIKAAADSIPELTLEPDSELKDPTMPSLPTITLDSAIQEDIKEATAALELHDATIAEDTVSEESSGIAAAAPKNTPAEPDPELMKIAANIANAKSFDEFDDQMAETLFGAELNTIAAQVLANPPPPEPANQELEAELSLAVEDVLAAPAAESTPTPEPAAITPPDQQSNFEKEFKDVYGENALEVSLESEPANTGMDLSASQRLATVRALNAENLPRGVAPPIPASNGAASNGAAATPPPASIEDQMKTSMTSTFAALSARPASANDDDDDDDEEVEKKKGGFFSRFRRS